MKKYDYYMSIGQFALWVVLITCVTIEAVAQIAMLPDNDNFTTGGKIFLSVLFVAMVAILASGGKIVYNEMKQAKRAYKDSRLADSIKANKRF